MDCVKDDSAAKPVNVKVGCAKNDFTAKPISVKIVKGDTTEKTVKCKG